jgi:hypothetical protein
MADSQKDVINKGIHPVAKDLIKKYVNEFAVSLILQAKTLADLKRHDLVLASQVDEALHLLQSGKQQQWIEKGVLTLGSILFGVFGKFMAFDFFRATHAEIAGYLGVGFLGIMAMFWALRRGA